MSKKEDKPYKKEPINNLLIVIIIMLLTVLGLLVFGPHFGISIQVASISVKGFVAFLIISTVGVFLLPFLGMIFFSIWLLVAGILGAVLFPVLIPAILFVLIILMLIRLLSGRQ